MAPPVPVPATERLETLDVLRGFALLGILAMNIRAMAAPFGAYMYPYALFDYTAQTAPPTSLPVSCSTSR